MTTLEERVKHLGNISYCLWVGAGVSMHLAAAGRQQPIAWQHLVETLERTAGIHSLPDGFLTFPERLDLVLRKLGRFDFQKALRPLVYGNVCRALVSIGVEAAKNAADPIPKEVRQLARLGLSASTIVNFNLEDHTTRIIASGGGGGSVQYFHPPVPGSTQVRSSNHVYGSVPFLRNLYHPHGVITGTGICVLGSGEYKALEGSLAFQLATHAAFGTTLVIVGMSLEDEYLRNQLSEFRDQIGHILWFSSRPESDDILRWVIANRVEVFEVSDWSDFWAALSACPRKEDDLYVVQNWLTAFQAAFSETNAHFGALSSIPFMRKTGSSGADLASYQVHLANCGLEIPKLEDEGLTSPYGPNDATTVTALVNFFSAEQKKRGLPTLNGS